MKKRLTEDDLIPLRDTFLDSEGNPIADEIDDQTVFPIAAGSWPSEFADAILERCAACDDFVGISPKGFKLHVRNPARAIFCGPCFVVFHNLLSQDRRVQ